MFRLDFQAVTTAGQHVESRRAAPTREQAAVRFRPSGTEGCTCTIGPRPSTDRPTPRLAAPWHLQPAGYPSHSIDTVPAIDRGRRKLRTSDHGAGGDNTTAGTVSTLALRPTGFRGRLARRARRVAQDRADFHAADSPRPARRQDRSGAARDPARGSGGSSPAARPGLRQPGGAGPAGANRQQHDCPDPGGRRAQMRTAGLPVGRGAPAPSPPGVHQDRPPPEPARVAETGGIDLTGVVRPDRFYTEAWVRPDRGLGFGIVAGYR